MKYNLDHYNLYMKVDLLIEPKVPATRMEWFDHKLVTWSQGYLWSNFSFLLPYLPDRASLDVYPQSISYNTKVLQEESWSLSMSLRHTLVLASHRSKEYELFTTKQDVHTKHRTLEWWGGNANSHLRTFRWVQ
jgi:hypothetical protein